MNTILLKDLAKLASYKNASLIITDVNEEVKIKPSNQLINDYPGDCEVYGIRGVDNHIHVILEQESSIINHWKTKYCCEIVENY